jgi:hypothetical protein
MEYKIFAKRKSVRDLYQSDKFDLTKGNVSFLSFQAIRCHLQTIIIVLGLFHFKHQSSSR